MKEEPDVVAAQRDAALESLDRLERILTRIGGYLDTPDQEALREAHALLIELGKRKSDAPPLWEDRPEKPKIARENVKLTAQVNGSTPSLASALADRDAETLTRLVLDDVPAGVCRRCLRPLQGDRCRFCQ